jgi:hypothetical protein
MNKGYFRKSPNVKMKDRTVVIETDIELLEVNKEYINTLSYDKKKKIYTIGYTTPATVTGILKDINSKFIIVEVMNSTLKKTYDVVIPVKIIEGFKVLSFEDDEHGEL